MGNDWAIEAHNKTGKRFLYHRAISRKEVRKLVAQALAKSSTGGVVIYRSTAAVAERLEVTEADLQRIWDEATEVDHEVILHDDDPNDYEHVHSNGPDGRDCNTCGTDCETEEEENPENFEKVASSNEYAFHNDVPDDHPGYTNWLSFVIEAAEENGGCKTCGCPPEDMPMVNRGTGWCCENHRKQQLARSNK